MNDTSSRATFSSLRARREAYQIASEILYEEPIEVRTVACQACGRWIGVHGQTITDPLTCPKCGAKTALPPYLRAKYLPRAAPMPPLSMPMEYIPFDLPDYLNEFDPPVPRWLIWLTAALILTGLIVVIVLIKT